jgi:hypothetical protein
MRWIVFEENPKPDQYIPVVALEEGRVLSALRNPYSAYKTKAEAIARAQQLRDQYNVKSIRIFYSEGNSATL